MRLILFFLLLTNFCSAQDYEADFFSKSKLFSSRNVETVTISQLKRDSVWFESHGYQFDILGNLTKNRTFGIDHSSTFYYDSNQVVFHRIDSTRLKVKSRVTILTQYNSNHTIAKEIKYFDDQFDTKCNNDIKLSEINLSDDDYCLCEITECKYNQFNKLEKEKSIHYQYRNYDTVQTHYFYNHKNQLIRMTKGSKSFSYKSNRNGNIKELITTSVGSDYVIERSKSKYSSSGHLLKRKTFSQGRMSKLEIYKYDKSNLLVLSKIELLGTKGKRIIERKFEYTFFKK